MRRTVRSSQQHVHRAVIGAASSLQPGQVGIEQWM
jgi:hypothetical protein